MTEEEVAVLVLSGDYEICYWCGKCFVPSTRYSFNICSHECFKGQLTCWRTDLEKWRATLKSHGAPDRWIG